MKGLLFYIIFFNEVLNIFSQISNKFNLQPSLVYHNCQDYGITSDIKGQDLLKEITPVTTNSLKIKGWFLVRSYDAINRTLFSIHSTNSLLFSFSYNIYDVKEYFYFFGKSYTNSFIISKDQWFFTYVSIKLDRPNNKVQSFLGIFTIADTLIMIMDTDLNGLNLDFQNLVFNLGSPSPTLKVVPSCAISKDISLYQNYPFVQETINSIILDLSSRETILYYYFDFFSINLNSSLVQSQALKRGQSHFESQQQSGNEFQDSQIMKLPVINLNELGSMILTFDTLLVDPPTNGQLCELLSIKLTTLDQYFDIEYHIYFKLVNQLVINNQFFTINTNILTQWTQISISLNSQQKTNIFIWPQKDYQVSLFQESNPTQFSQVIMKFGSDINQCKFKIDNVRLYAGHYLQETDSCLLQAGEQKQECLRCQDGYLLDRSDQQMVCSNQGVPSEISYQKQQSRIKCPINMYYYNQKCQCLKGFYLMGDTCERCPKNCLDCTSAYSCNKIKYQRDSQGKCINNLFDDEFSCITPIPFIETQGIAIFNQSSSNYDPLCLYDAGSKGFTYKPNTSFQPQFSFFYSFSIQYQKNPGKAPLSVFEIEGNEVITFLGEEVLEGTSTLTYICVLIKGSEELKLQIQQKATFWVGVWTNFSDHIIILHQNGQTISKQITNRKIEYSVFSPSICVGPCQSIFGSSYLCSIIIPPLLVTNEMLNPYIIGIENIFYYHSQDKQVKVKYIYDSTSQDQTQIMDTNGIAGLAIKIVSTQQSFNKMKGIGFSNKQQGSIKSIETYGFLVFQCSIQIDKIENQSLLLQYQIDSLTVRYFLIPDDFQKYISFRICMNEVCRDSNYIKIEISKPSQLLIIPKNKTPYEKLIRIIDFEVISNLQRELITLLYEHQFDIEKKALNIQISQTGSEYEYLYFLNSIKFYEAGSFFQIEYRKSEQCFVYMNINPMICIQNKQGFYTYQNKQISYQECQNLNDSSVNFYIPNPYTQECMLTDIVIKKCKEIDFDGQSYYCKKCKDPYAIPNLDPYKSFLCNECKDGYFLSEELDKCLVCHLVCSKCTKQFDNCTECAHDMQLPPSCQCIEPNYYLETDYVCYQCQEKCQTCVQLKSYCLTCSENRIYPPICSCKPGYQENSITKKCDKINCDSKCLTCLDNKSNCDVCAQNRIEPPLCKCGQNYYEDSKGDCQQCPASTYYDLITQSCKTCLKVCAECQDSADNCISCQDGFILLGNKCYCNSNSIPYVTQKGETKCLNKMDLNLEIRLIKNVYSLTFVFGEELQDIDFQQYQVKDILSVYLSMTSKEAFLIKNPKIDKNEFSVDLIVKENIQSNQGCVYFHINQVFVSKSEQFALTDFYNTNPLEFQIGPFIFKEEVLENKKIDSIQEAIKNSNQSVIDLVQKFQFVFYILNTLQPTMLFFLLKLNYPPNLYKFYQIIGTLIFSKISEYQSHLVQQQYNIFNFQFNINEVLPASKFSQFGFSDSLIVNCPIIILKYAVIMLGLFIGFILTKILSSQKLQITGEKITLKLFERINIENEANLLTLVLSLMIQFSSMDASLFMSRQGIYISIIMVIILIATFIFNFQQINNNQIQASQYSNIFTERLNNKKGKLERNYFFFQLIKKYLLIIIVFALHSFPLQVCTLCGSLLLVSSISTILLKPYKSQIQRIIKILGEFILSIIWFFNVYIVQLENQLYKNNIIDDDLVSSYLKSGMVVIFSLLIYNSIYIFEFIYSIIRKIKDRGKPIQELPEKVNYNPIKPSDLNFIKGKHLFKAKKVRFKNQG